MRITVYVGEKRFDVDIEQLPFQDTIDRVVVNGKPLDIAVVSDWINLFSKNLIIGGRSYQVEFEQDKHQLPSRVYMLGHAVDVKLDFPGKGKLRRPEMTGLWGEDSQVRAPLPGRIIAVKVSPGQEVRAGELVCRLEAMKMENELASPRDGVIKEVLVSEGENVELDQVV
ncbi:MAG TPA: biotin/lipoyl-binding protein, partial [Firmicutes bacterium]|nr:biotin/lipoyl-binding protein [Bacillota bacterium]